MSNSLAIAAVTATLRNLISRGVQVDIPDASITTKPPDKARNGGEAINQLNLFLYHAAPDAAWRNMNLPNQVKPGESGTPPLALTLYYLLTAYGVRDDDTASHQLLGRAMSILHDHSLLGKDEIKAALPDNDLYLQIERVRITPQPLSLDEMSKLWGTFQTEYRISVAYQVSAVLIDSNQPVKAALPVLKRGSEDRGAVAQPDLVPPFPTLEDISLPHQQPSALPGDTISLLGHNLAGGSVRAVLTNPELPAPLELNALPDSTDSAVRVTLPVDPANWVAGFYTVAVHLDQGGQPRQTNELSLPLAPTITSPLPMNVARDMAGNATVILTCEPDVRPEQRAALLLGSREVLRTPHATQTNTLTFVVTDVETGDYFVRLRIDGIDSLLVDRSVTPPTFEPDQKVTIT